MNELATTHNTVHSQHSSPFITGCDDCHPHDGISVSAGSGIHADGTVDFAAAASGKLDSPLSYSGDGFASTNCTTNDCHNADAGDWAAGNLGADECVDCHAATGDDLDRGGFPPVSGAHAAHGADGDADVTECEACHGTDNGGQWTRPVAGGSHANNLVNFAAAVTHAANGAGPADDTCSTSSCHSASGRGQTAIWGTDTSVNCDHCHYYEATPDSGNNSGANWAITGSHNAHFQAGVNSALCTACHADASGQTWPRAHITVGAGTDGVVLTEMAEALPDEAAVADTALLLAGEWTDPGAGNPTCSNAACHDPSNVPLTATWTVAGGGVCTFCHSDSNPGTGSHDGHLLAATATNYGITVACTDCHVDNATGSNYDHTLDSPGVDFSGVSYVGNSCGTNDCHRSDLQDNGPVRAYTWGTPLTNDCASCHEGSGMASNTHDNHLGSNALTGNDLTFNTGDNCVVCHDATTSGGGLAGGGQHLDTTVDLSFSTTAPAVGDGGTSYEEVAVVHNVNGAGAADDTCSNVRCHNGVDTPEWDGVTSPIACGDCHGTAEPCRRARRRPGVTRRTGTTTRSTRTATTVTARWKVCTPRRAVRTTWT